MGFHIVETISLHLCFQCSIYKCKRGKNIVECLAKQKQTNNFMNSQRRCTVTLLHQWRNKMKWKKKWTHLKQILTLMMAEKCNGYDFISFYFAPDIVFAQQAYSAITIEFWVFMCVCVCDYLLENGLIPKKKFHAIV